MVVEWWMVLASGLRGLICVSGVMVMVCGGWRCCKKGMGVFITLNLHKVDTAALA